jgi:REP element-mobilizing transposase RayT
LQIPIREKHHRLLEEAYKGFVSVSFTANIKDRNRLFVDDTIFTLFQDILLDVLHSLGCSSYVCLFMPDHLHSILAGEKENADVKGCIEMFKQKTGYWLSKNDPFYRWQKDFYDHIIRNDEDMSAQLRYILLR